MYTTSSDKSLEDFVKDGVYTPDIVEILDGLDMYWRLREPTTDATDSIIYEPTPGVRLF